MFSLLICCIDTRDFPWLIHSSSLHFQNIFSKLHPTFCTFVLSSLHCNYNVAHSMSNLYVLITQNQKQTGLVCLWTKYNQMFPFVSPDYWGISNISVFFNDERSVLSELRQKIVFFKCIKFVKNKKPLSLYVVAWNLVLRIFYNVFSEL